MSRSRRSIRKTPAASWTRCKISEDGIAVMVNLHSVELVKEYCSRVIGIAHGKIVFDGHPSQLNERILHQLYGEEANQIH